MGGLSRNTSDERKLAAGRGSGTGKDYKPWLYVHEFGSRGLASRGRGRTTNRVHHFLSELELKFYFVLEWSPSVVDIREQFPLLPVDETLAIATDLGVRHPADPTGRPRVMTTDFYLSVQRGLVEEYHARCVKYATGDKGLENVRTLEKLEIERRYWLIRGVDWGVVTEHEVPDVAVANIQWLLPYSELDALVPLPRETVDQIAAYLAERLAKGGTPLAKHTTACDAHLQLKVGSSLKSVRYLIASRRWTVDLMVPLNPSRPLQLLNAGLQRAARRGGAR
jgi:hypothetical protein